MKPIIQTTNEFWSVHITEYLIPGILFFIFIFKKKNN